MKIIKLNDNQIKCTLTRADLAKRQIKINELTYGSKKARELFVDMMMKAKQELGFESEDIPIMVEAIPCEDDSIEILITKVEEPDELDVRFSKFAPEFDYDDEKDFDAPHAEVTSDQDLAQLYKEYSQAGDAKPVEKKHKNKMANTYDINSSVVIFDSLDNLIRVARLARGISIKTSLFIDKAGKYYLYIKGGKVDKSYARTFYAMKEYGKSERNGNFEYDYLREHCKLLIKDNALGTLSEM